MSDNPFDKLSNKMADEFKKSIDRIAQPVVPDIPKLHVPPMPLSPAESTYKRLGTYIKKFEAELDNEHEVGARLVSFGQVVTFHIEGIGYYGPDIIDFKGINSNGERVQLIQHTSQLNVLLVAMKKIGDKACRIGYLWDEKS